MISLIVPSHDEAQLIAAMLDALHVAARALQLDYEVVVDDASGDGTTAIAECQARACADRIRHIAAARCTRATTWRCGTNAGTTVAQRSRHR